MQTMPTQIIEESDDITPPDSFSDNSPTDGILDQPLETKVADQSKNSSNLHPKEIIELKGNYLKGTAAGQEIGTELALAAAVEAKQAEHKK